MAAHTCIRADALGRTLSTAPAGNPVRLTRRPCSPPQCKHQLAARIADALGKTRESTVSDLAIVERLAKQG